MKKIISLFIIVFVLLIMTGCENSEVKEIKYVEDHGYDTVSNPTYKFIGTSDHFGFETGKVYYGDNNERYILIKNFQIIRNIKNYKDIKSYSFQVLFDEKEMFTDEELELGKRTLEDCIKEIHMEETGKYNEDGWGESDAFVETTKDTFKESIKMEIKYCYNNSKCETEVFNLKYQ